jgi:hypothetical protein
LVGGLKKVFLLAMTGESLKACISFLRPEDFGDVSSLIGWTREPGALIGQEFPAIIDA